jgi:4-hydroxy-tetrahydrodipicolinate reductase
MIMRRLAILLLIVAFDRLQSFALTKCSSRYATVRLVMSSELCVMVNGMPGPMAVEVAKSGIDRGISIVPIGFTGPSTVEKDVVLMGKSRSEKVTLQQGPGCSDNAISTLKALKAKYPNLVVVDYTHPSAVMSNVKAYVEADCDFVMGTTGFDMDQVLNLFSSGSNYAIIAPNMAKQIVALQSALQQTASRFPGAFEGYDLQVRVPLLSSANAMRCPSRQQ